MNHSSSASNMGTSRDSSRDSSMGASSSSSTTLRDAMRDPKGTGERLLNEANPRIRETIDQVSEVASDLYGRASTWLGEGNNRNYGFVALAATAGIVGFFIGRSMRSDSSEF